MGCLEARNPKQQLLAERSMNDADKLFLAADQMFASALSASSLMLVTVKSAESIAKKLTDFLEPQKVNQLTENSDQYRALDMIAKLRAASKKADKLLAVVTCLKAKEFPNASAEALKSTLQLCAATQDPVLALDP